MKNEIKVSGPSVKRDVEFEPVEVTVKAGNSDEVIITGLHQDHISVKGHGGITSGAGCGNPWIMFEWKGKYGRIHAADLLAAWVRASGFEEDAKRIEASK